MAERRIIDNERVEIAMASDAGYAVGMLVCAASIALWASRDVELSFTFLDGGFDDNFYRALESRLRAIHPASRFRREKINQESFSTFPEWRGNKMAYARFLLPELLPTVRHVIYCDVDFLWTADIANLWRMRRDNVILQAVKDPQEYKYKEHHDWFAKNNLKYDGCRYFCSGLLLMNLKLFRERCAVAKIYEFVRRYPSVMFPDQDALNCLFGNETILLNDDWMRFTKFLTSELFTRPLVLHFVTECPWKGVRLLRAISDPCMAWFAVHRVATDQEWSLKLHFCYFVTRSRLIRTVMCGFLKLLRMSDYAKQILTCATRRVELPGVNK